MLKAVDEITWIFEERDIKKDGSLNTKRIENDWLRNRLTKIVLPDGLKKIPEGAFKGCKFLREINIPDSVTEIGNDAFQRCSSLKEINIPDGVTEIGPATFFLL